VVVPAVVVPVVVPDPVPAAVVDGAAGVHPAIREADNRTVLTNETIFFIMDSFFV